MDPDPAVALNNFLLNHDLTLQSLWVMNKEGQDHNADYNATAIFRSRPVGQGSGTSKDAAKRAAAAIVLASGIDPNSMAPDPAVELNNFLQTYPTGKLTLQFHWVMDRDGQDHAIHIATAMFRGQPVGKGRGTSKGAAKANGEPVPERDPVDDLNDYLHEIQGPKKMVPLLQFTSVQKDPNILIHTGTYTFREVIVGTGQGITIDAAQHAAAREALQYFYTRGFPGGNIEPYLTPMEIFLSI